MDFTPYNLEQLVLGAIMRHPTESKNLIATLPYSRFVYGVEGKLGRSDHAKIMQAILMAKSPSPVNVKGNISDSALNTYIDALVDMVSGRYRVYEFNAQDFSNWVDQVDANGIYYNTLAKMNMLGQGVSTEETFLKFVEKQRGKDVDGWLGELVSTISPKTADRTGYRHVSTVVPEVIDRWRRQRAGEQLAILDCGLPIFVNNALFPVENAIAVHGMNGGGKSALVHQTDLGTAIGLYVNGVKGCVAINSLEMSYITLINRNVGMLSGFDMKRLVMEPHTISDEDMKRLEDWAWFCERLPIYIDDSNYLKVSALEFRSSGLHASDKGPVWSLSIDYLGMLKGDKDSVEQNYALGAESAKDISKLGPCVKLIAQSTFEDMKTWLAGPNGIRYSKAVSQAMDIVMEVYNPQYLIDRGMNPQMPSGVTNPYQLWVEIQKNRHFGILGWFAVNWTPEFTRLSDPDQDSLFGGNAPVFTHLEQAWKMMQNHTRAEVPAVEDTYLGSFS